MEVLQHYTIPLQHGAQTWTKQKTPTRITQELSPDWRSRDLPWETRRIDIEDVGDSIIEETKKDDRDLSTGKSFSSRMECSSKENTVNTTKEILQALNEIETGDKNKHQNHDKNSRCKEPIYR